MRHCCLRSTLLSCLNASFGYFGVILPRALGYTQAKSISTRQRDLYVRILLKSKIGKPRETRVLCHFHTFGSLLTLPLTFVQLQSNYYRLHSALAYVAMLQPNTTKSCFPQLQYRRAADLRGPLGLQCWLVRVVPHFLEARQAQELVVGPFLLLFFRIVLRVRLNIRITAHCVTRLSGEGFSRGHVVAAEVSVATYGSIVPGLWNLRPSRASSNAEGMSMQTSTK